MGRPAITELRDIIVYNPRTGELSWREPARHWFASDTHWHAYKAQAAGRQPFAVEHSMGYLHGRLGKDWVLAHVLAWALHTGSWPEGEIDHINHVKTDNRATNLRDVSRVQNSTNAGRNKRNTSGVTGVTWQQDRRRWAAQIMVNGKTVPLGRYVLFEDAVRARKAADIRYGFHKNHGLSTGEIASDG